MKVSMKQQNNDFELLARQIETATDALRQDALVVINRSVTARAWLTGYYIVEYEQHGKDRAEYGEKLLVRLSIYDFDRKGYLMGMAPNLYDYPSGAYINVNVNGKVFKIKITWTGAWRNQKTEMEKLLVLSRI